MPGFVECRANADDRVLPQKLTRPTRAERIVKNEPRKVQSVEIDLHSQAECLKGPNFLECLVQLRSVGPESLVTERIVPENLPALLLEIA